MGRKPKAGPAIPNPEPVKDVAAKPEPVKEPSHHPIGPSSLERASFCPGSVVLSEGISDTPSTDADEGTMLHERVASGVMDGLTQEQVALVELCREQLERFAPLDKWQFEATLSLYDDNFEVLTFGTVDALLEEDDRCIIFDWKFGRVPVTQANENLQLQSYSACAIQSTGKAQCIAHIFQPRIKALTDGVFGVDVVEYIKNMIIGIKEANRNGIVLHYHERACKYCRARLNNCPEYNRNVCALVTTHTSDITDPLAVSRLLDVAKQAKKWAANIEHRAKYMIQFDKVPVPGWEIRAKAGSREITNAQAIYEAVVGAGTLTHEEFMALVTMKIGALENVYAAKCKAKDNTPLAKAKRDLNELIADAVERKPDSFVLYKNNDEEGETDNA